jgi:hypothetical protein
LLSGGRNTPQLPRAGAGGRARGSASAIDNAMARLKWYLPNTDGRGEGTEELPVTAEEVERAKETLPFGWGRFGKAIDRLEEISEPSESLEATCVALNPSYRYKARFVPGTPLGAAHALHELTKTTNVVLACTSERLIVIGTGGGGVPRDHTSISYDGVTIVSRGKTEFVLGLAEGEMRVRGAAKQQVPAFLDALAAHARPAESSPA